VRSSCFGSDGRSLFRALFARRSPVRFYAFDLLWLNACDLRGLPLLERKARLFALVPADHARLLYVDHVEGDGARFLHAAAAMDLEGVVGKYAAGTYQTDEGSTSRVKVRIQRTRRWKAAPSSLSAEPPSSKSARAPLSRLS
jgi:ATP-dependent DNA ligase